MSHPQFDAYRLIINYEWTGLDHKFQSWVMPDVFSTAPGLPFSDYAFEQRGNVSIAADEAVDALIIYLKPMFHTLTTFINAELWKHADGDGEGLFLSSYTIGETGSSATTNVTASQNILTSRTNLGNTKKFYLEEITLNASNPVAWIPDASGNTVQQFGYYVTDEGTYMRDRFGGYPIALMRYFPGQSEATFKRRFRD